MYSKTIDYLEKFDNQHDFERMCTDILNALGYKDVVPIAPRGGSDGGKDITFTTESGGKGLACVTLRKDIDKKFEEDFSKRKAGEYEKYILFCTAHLSAPLKLKFAKYCIDNLQAEFEPKDIEALRSLLDSALKQIRAMYLGIQDNTAIRNKIRNILFDASNEVEAPERWKTLSIVANLEMIGLFNLIKNEDVAMLCQTGEELQVLGTFKDAFMRLRKVSSEMDDFIFAFVGSNIGGNTYTPYWQKIGEYCKLRLVGVDKATTERRINTWNVASGFEDCERIYELLNASQELKAVLERVGEAQQAYIKVRDNILELKGFKNDG